MKAAEKDGMLPDTEADTKEVGTKEGEKKLKEENAEGETPAEEKQAEPIGPFVKPELKFLYDKDGRAFIGRKKTSKRMEISMILFFIIIPPFII